MVVKNTRATVMYSEFFSNLSCERSNRILPRLDEFSLNRHVFNAMFGFEFLIKHHFIFK